MNRNNKSRPKNKIPNEIVEKQKVSQYKAPIPIKLSTGEDMFSMREYSSKPIIIKDVKDRIT